MTLTANQIQYSFWVFEPENSFPPAAINYPIEYDGDSKLNLICTQLDLSSYQQSKLIKEWCRLLPTLTSVNYLWFNSRTTQAMFEAACDLPTLEGLFIEWSGIKDLSPLINLKKLKYFHLGSSPSIESIVPLSSMNQLIVLHIENLKHIRNLKPLSVLTNLEGLAVEGSLWRTQIVESLRHLSPLKNLRYLFLGNLKSLDNTLIPLLELENLMNLTIGYNWPIDELRMLKESLPELKYGSLFSDELIEIFGKRSTGE
jgi:hypothetical protein